MTTTVISIEGEIFEAHMMEMSAAELAALLNGAELSTLEAWKQKVEAGVSLSGLTYSRNGGHFNVYIGDDAYPQALEAFDRSEHAIPASFLRSKDVKPIGKSYIVREKYLSNARFELIIEGDFDASRLSFTPHSCLLPDGKLATILTPLYDTTPFTRLEAWTEREDFYLVSDKGEHYTLHFD
jgi:hypothetical protein